MMPGQAARRRHPQCNHARVCYVTPRNIVLLEIQGLGRWVQ
jgi:hypothetical protein